MGFFVSSLHTKFYLMPTPGSSWERAQPQGQCCLSPFQGPLWFTGPNLCLPSTSDAALPSPPTPKKISAGLGARKNPQKTQKLLINNWAPSGWWGVAIAPLPEGWVVALNSELGEKKSPTLNCSAPVVLAWQPWWGLTEIKFTGLQEKKKKKQHQNFQGKPRFEFPKVHGCYCSAAQLCPTLWDPMDCSTPGFPVHHQLRELAQTHVHRVDDAIQPSRPLSSPSPPAFNLSQH